MRSLLTVRSFAVALLWWVGIASSGSEACRAQETDSPPVCIQLEPGQKSAPIAVEDFAWLTGCWTGSGLGGDCAETWSDPLAGTMIGSFLFTENGKPIFSEHFALIAKEDSVTLKLKHFHQDMKGWEEKDKFIEFPFVKRIGNRFHFGGLTYVAIDETHMEVYVTMKEGEKMTELKFEFRRSK